MNCICFGDYSATTDYTRTTCNTCLQSGRTTGLQEQISHVCCV